MTADVAAWPPAAPNGRLAYSLGEAAVMLGKSPRTLKRLHLSGEMPAKRLGRSLMIPASWLMEFTAWPPEDGAAA